MKKSQTKTKENKVEVWILKEPSILDTNIPWYSAEQTTSNIGIRWFRWRWLIRWVPEWLKRWDLWYNNETKQIECYTTWPYDFAWWWVPEWLANDQYSEWEYIIYNTELFYANTTPTVGLFVPSEWTATWLYNTVIWGRNYLKIKTFAPNNIPTWVWTTVDLSNIISWTDRFLYNLINIIVTANWIWQLQASIRRTWITTNTEIESRFLIDWVVPISEHLDSWLGITPNPITKTTENITVEKLIKWSTIELQVKHDNAWPIQVEATFTLVQI